MKASTFNKAIKQIGEDDDGFVDIYNEYYTGVYLSAYCILLDKEDAKDVASNVFLKIYTQAKEFGYIESPKALLYTMARNEAKNFLLNKKPNTELEAAEEIATTLDEESIYREINLETALNRLEEDERAIITEYMYFGYDFKELASEHNITYAAVRGRYYRGLKKLKELLTKKL